jgi:hypothetical protein
MLWRRDRDVVHPHTADAAAGTSGNSNDADSAADRDEPLRRAVQYLEGQIEKTRGK